jgi:hypothetical protein
MNKSTPFFSRRLSLLLLCTVGVGALLAPPVGAQSTWQDTKSDSSSAATPSATAPAAQTDTQKKAAERKRRFEEQKALLDGGGRAGPGATGARAPVTDSEFYIDPIAANMVPNESQELHVWDRRGTGNDVSARVSWGLSSSGIVEMSVKGYATITAKMPGTVNVTGNIDGHAVEAIVTVYRGEKLPSGVPRVVAAPPPVRTGGRRNTMTVITNPN